MTVYKGDPSTEEAVKSTVRDTTGVVFSVCTYRLNHTPGSTNLENSVTVYPSRKGHCYLGTSVVSGAKSPEQPGVPTSSRIGIALTQPYAEPHLVPVDAAGTEAGSSARTRLTTFFTEILVPINEPPLIQCPFY